MQQMRQIREVIALAVLAISAYTDLKERNIYTMPLIVSASGAALMSVITLICAPAGEECDILLSELAGPALAGVLLIAAAKRFADHIGEGDAYLLATLCMIIGMKDGFLTMMISSAAAALYVMVYASIGAAAGKIRIGNKRIRYKGRGIPFAPFMMGGFIAIMIYGKY
ncbi:MAG: prepilin peptidase [Lachnospiraceae bacterium]|nr:prepilin peptidase [Lachnospiraceae bacterium]